MSTIEEFEALLKEVVNAKRLSASKMEKLTEVSLKLMENDTQLVSVLYRTHKSLRGSAKISSLYVFDALCRAARSQVVKRNLSGDINSEKGNCATFLLKIDSVLDGLFQDILSSGVPEAKEKAKKILDIWTKSNAFPANVLARLGAQGKVAENADSTLKEPIHTAVDMPMTTSDPRKQPTPPTKITPPPAANSTTPPTAEAAQAALLALLSSAAAANNASISQTPANTANHPPSSSPQVQLQLALLQQLSNHTNGGPPSGMAGGPLQPQVPPIPAPLATGMHPLLANPNTRAQNTNFPGPSSISPVANEPYAYSGPGHRDPRPSRFDEAPDSRGRGEYYCDNRRRGGNARGIRGGIRGRGRGEFRGMSERDYDSSSWDRGRGSQYEGGPPPNRRRRLNSSSRSPSPRRRDSKPTYSPPQRPSLASPVEHTRAPLPGALEPGKDEFGRDIRPGSEEPEEIKRGETENVTVRHYDGRSIPDTAEEAPTAQAKEDRRSDPPIVAQSDTNLGAIGLDSFDISTFDPTSPKAWEILGNAFQITHGYVPTQEELIQLVMAGMEMAMGMGMNPDVGPGGSGNLPEIAGSGIGTGATKGEGLAWRLNAGSAYGEQSYTPNSDAVVLGPNAEQTSYTEETGSITGPADIDASPQSVSAEAGGVNRGGQMQKVGDRWIFVRDGP